MADDLTAELAGIRKDIRAAFIGYGMDEPGSEALKLAYPPAVMALRASRLLAAVEAVLELGDRSGEAKDPHLPGHVDVHAIREAIRDVVMLGAFGAVPERKEGNDG